MSELLLAHILNGVVLTIAVVGRFFAALFAAKYSRFLKNLVITTAVLQLATGMGLVFAGASVLHVCGAMAGVITLALVLELLARAIIKKRLVQRAE